MHCLQGLEIAIENEWYNFRTFNPKEYEFYERVDHGDLNWIIPGKFMAFMGPVNKRIEGKSGFTPEDYSEIFQVLGVNKVVRLNEIIYDRKRFINNGISHTDLFFLDGSSPSNEIVDEFIDICEKHF